jgi:hypothetical protein
MNRLYLMNRPPHLYPRFRLCPLNPKFLMSHLLRLCLLSPKFLKNRLLRLYPQNLMFRLNRFRLKNLMYLCYHLYLLNPMFPNYL